MIFSRQKSQTVELLLKQSALRHDAQRSGLAAVPALSYEFKNSREAAKIFSDKPPVVGHGSKPHVSGSQLYLLKMSI